MFIATFASYGCRNFLNFLKEKAGMDCRYSTDEKPSTERLLFLLCWLVWGRMSGMGEVELVALPKGRIHRFIIEIR
jgi:hypothetical protein